MGSTVISPIGVKGLVPLEGISSSDSCRDLLPKNGQDSSQNVILTSKEGKRQLTPSKVKKSIKTGKNRCCRWLWLQGR